MQFERELSYEEWESVGAELFKVDQAWQWWVGDWINYGEKKYGQTYEGALALTDKSYSSLAHAKSVASEFASCRRRQLSWSHHEAVQGLEPKQQDAILDEAEREGKPRSWVRQKVKEVKGDCEPDDSEVDEDLPQFDYDPQTITAWRKCEMRVSTLRKLFDELTETERELIRDWLAT